MMMKTQNIFVVLLIAVMVLANVPTVDAADVWGPLGAGLTGTEVRFLHVWDGKLVAAGDFSTADGAPANNIAIWDGVQWLPLGDGWDVVDGITTHNGQLAVYGLRPDSTETEIAAWDGISWAAIVKSAKDPAIRRNNLASLTGKIYQADFNGETSNWTSSTLWEFDGTVWRGIRTYWSGPGVSTAKVSEMKVLDGELFVFGTPSGEVDSYDGANWTSYGTNLDMHAANGLAIVGGILRVAGYDIFGDPVVSTWNGVSWDLVLHCLTSRIDAVVEYSGELIISGVFDNSCVPSSSVVSWDGSIWSGVGGGMNHDVTSLEIYDGKLVAAGRFSTAGGVPTSLIAQLEVSTPVAISGFRARPTGNDIELSWKIVADERFDGFYVYRSESGDVDELLNTEMLSHEIRSFIDDTATPGSRYSYQLVAVGGETGDVRSQRATVALPKLTASLRQNIPNPFNPTTTIRFVVPEQGNVTITVYGPDGQKVRTLVDQSYSPGEQSAAWDGTDENGKRVASGVYYYRMRIGKITQSKKMLLIK